MSSTYIGKSISRVDGPEKVTGAAKYAAEFTAEDLIYGVVVSSPITKGRIKSIDTSRALAVEGMIEVLTHKNRPQIAWFNRNYKDQDSPKGEHFRALYDEKILFSGQPIALCLASTFESARFAASLIEIEYEEEKFNTDLKASLKDSYDPGRAKSGFQKPKGRGDAHKAYQESAIRMSADFHQPAQHHNPMEMFATTVVFDKENESYKIFDKTQGTQNSLDYVSKVFGISAKKIQICAPFVGGAFGSGLRPQYQLYLAVMATKLLKRSVRVVLTRQQMFSFGHRPETYQHVELATNKDGKLQALKHEAVAETSQFEDYVENVVNWSSAGYACDNVEVKYELAALDLYTPLDMRAPGATTGVFALECAMDEMAYAAHMDPLEFRLLNYSDEDEMNEKPYSSKALKAAYRQGAERFGWAKRKMEPGSQRDGHRKIGWGFATGFWDAMVQKAAATVKLNADGTLEVSSAITDIGTGTATIMSQIAAQEAGLPIEKVKAVIGDSKSSPAPLQGGSWTAASIGNAVQIACETLKEELLKLAQKNQKDLFQDLKPEDVVLKKEHLMVKSDSSRKISLKDLIASSDQDCLEVEGAFTPDMKTQMKYSMHTHSAVFVEVKVDEDLGTIEVSRVVSAIAAGRILNPKTARSQILGGVVWGIGHALQEETLLDNALGKYMNHNYAEYHIPVNKDIHDIDVIFVEEHDEIINPMGVKGLGEIGLVGVAAAIANAVFHATGKRIRELPLTLDKVIS